MSTAVVIIAVGALVAVSCSLLGVFLVLRKMSLMGDAISHAVLPGIVIAFLVTGDRSPIPMVIGAGLLGVLTVFLVESLLKTGRMHEDASIGVVFPALFSLGVILISRYAAAVDLDLDCVLYGEIAYAALDKLYIGDISIGPKSIWVMGGILLANLALVVTFYKELKIATFDPALAKSLGFPPGVVHYLLMAAVSVTVVGAFESVGAILVVAMLIVPASAAYLLTERLSRMLMIAAGIGVASSFGGYRLASACDVSPAGGMAVATGVFFGAAFLFSPSHGVVAAMGRRKRLTDQLSGNLLLLHLHKNGEVTSVEEINSRFGWSVTRVRAVAANLARAGLLEGTSEGFRCTDLGASTLDTADREGLPVHSGLSN